MTLEIMQGMERVSGVAASAFVSGIWQGVVLAAGVALCLRLVPKTTAAIRFLVWSAVFLVLAMLPVLRGFAMTAGGIVSGQVVHAVQVDVRWSFAITAVWVMLSVYRAVGLGLSAVRLHGIWKRATPVVSGAGAELSRVEKGGRNVQLCTSTDVDRPSVIGFFSPRVLIPVEMFGELTRAELEQIVLHEVGHLRRADDWINLLQKIGLVLFPLNPALVWIERRLCFERELACDDDVLQLTKAPKAYATCLTTLAERRLDRRALSLSLGAWERKSELSRRVYRILSRGERMGPMQARVVLAGLVLVLVGGATGLSRCPQLVSFSRAASPVVADAQGLGAGAEYQPVVFRGAGAAHETLLKASMPMGARLAPEQAKTTGQGLPERSRQVHRAVSQRVKKSHSRMTQQWVVLTSWDERGSARMVMTVAREQVSFPSYAAVPTAGGWLVFQL